jgi:hypothetical protein
MIKKLIYLPQYYLYVMYSYIKNNDLTFVYRQVLFSFSVTQQVHNLTLLHNETPRKTREYSNNI